MIPPDGRCGVADDDGTVRAGRPLDDTLEALANERRRRVVYELRDNDGVVDLEVLAGALAAALDDDPGSIHTHLYHTDLPRLAACGIVDYDPEDDCVWYSGGSTVTDLIGAIAEYE